MNVIISGKHLLTSLGNEDVTYSSIMSKCSGIKKHGKEWYAIPAKKQRRSFQEMVEEAIDAASNDAQTKVNRYTILVLATCSGDSNDEQSRISDVLDLLKTTYGFGEAIAISTACSSGTNAIGYAAKILRAKIGFTSAMVVGCDVVTPTLLSGFSSILAMAKKPAVLGSGNGISLGEGCAALYIESQSKLEKRCELIKSSNAEAKLPRAYASIIGNGNTSDGYKITAPEPTGKYACAAIIQSIKQINYIQDSMNGDENNGLLICAHGTGSKLNDERELKMYEGFKGAACNSNKPNIGHTLGASGVISAVLALKSLETGEVPPTICTDGVGWNGGTYPLKYAMISSFAFGGNNAVVALSKAPADIDIDYKEDLCPAEVVSGEHLIDEKSAQLTLDDLDLLGIDQSDWTKMDDVSRQEVAAIAKIAPQIKDKDRVGLYVASLDGSLASMTKMMEEVKEGKSDAALFPNTVNNAPEGWASIECRLHGPSLSVIASPLSLFNVSNSLANADFDDGTIDEAIIMQRYDDKICWSLKRQEKVTQLTKDVVAYFNDKFNKLGLMRVTASTPLASFMDSIDFAEAMLELEDKFGTGHFDDGLRDIWRDSTSVALYIAKLMTAKWLNEDKKKRLPKKVVKAYLKEYDIKKEDALVAIPKEVEKQEQ